VDLGYGVDLCDGWVGRRRAPSPRPAPRWRWSQPRHLPRCGGPGGRCATTSVEVRSKEVGVGGSGDFLTGGELGGT
jgi:hypothetical protein